MPQVISLKMEFPSDIPTRYLMVQTTDMDDAKSIAASWSKAQEGEYPSSIDVHKGFMDAPISPTSEIFDGAKVWELPF